MSQVGRKPQGSGLIAPLAGSDHAKRRMTLFLQTLSGQTTISAACGELKICPSRFFAHRAGWLQEALALLEPRSAGRPPKQSPEIDATEVSQLAEQIRQLETRVVAAEVESLLAAALPHVIHRARSLKKTNGRDSLRSAKRS
jgi:hypothetical protein